MYIWLKTQVVESVRKHSLSYSKCKFFIAFPESKLSISIDFCIIHTHDPRSPCYLSRQTWIPMEKQMNKDVDTIINKISSKWIYARYHLWGMIKYNRTPHIQQELNKSVSHIRKKDVHLKPCEFLGPTCEIRSTIQSQGHYHLWLKKWLRHTPERGLQSWRHEHRLSTHDSTAQKSNCSKIWNFLSPDMIPQDKSPADLLIRSLSQPRCSKHIVQEFLQPVCMRCL